MLHKGIATRIITAIPFRNVEPLENTSGVEVLQNRSFVQAPSADGLRDDAPRTDPDCPKVGQGRLIQC